MVSIVPSEMARTPLPDGNSSPGSPQEGVGIREVSIWAKPGPGQLSQPSSGRTFIVATQESACASPLAGSPSHHWLAEQIPVSHPSSLGPESSRNCRCPSPSCKVSWEPLVMRPEPRVKRGIRNTTGNGAHQAPALMWEPQRNVFALTQVKLPGN